jgi:hypothetical protein
MHCTNCGTALSAGTSFCANCGTPNTSQQPSQQTPQPVPVYSNTYAAPPASAPEGLAVASLVVSLSTLLFTFGLFSFVGAILGHVALSNMRRTGKGGRGLAIAGIAIGWSVTALWVLGVVLIFAIAAGTAGYWSSY